MKRFGFALALVCGLALSVAAAPLVTPPPGWKGGPNAELVQVTGSAPHFGGAHGTVEAEQYTPEPGIVLDVARITAPTSAPADAARAEIDALKQAREQVDDATKQIEATVDASEIGGPGVHQHTRVVIVATKDKIVAVEGDCIAGAVMNQALFDACKAALATLDSGVDVKDRIAVTPTAASPSPSPSPSPSSHMGDGSRIPMPPMVVRQDTSEPASDKRPLFVGAGIVGLAAAFWWNRRRRERYAAEAAKDGDER